MIFPIHKLLLISLMKKIYEKVIVDKSLYLIIFISMNNYVYQTIVPMYTICHATLGH